MPTEALDHQQGRPRARIAVPGFQVGILVGVGKQSQLIGIGAVAAPLGRVEVLPVASSDLVGPNTRW